MRQKQARLAAIDKAADDAEAHVFNELLVDVGMGRFDTGKETYCKRMLAIYHAYEIAEKIINGG